MECFNRKMTELAFQQELEIVKQRNEQKEFRRKIREERHKYNVKPKVETNKVLAFYLFALLNAIVIYAMVAMWRFADLSYLGVLITDIAAQVLVYAIYCLKSYKAKKSEEDLKFEMEKLRGSADDILCAGAENPDPPPLPVETEVTLEEEQ